jgi:hypothetical protein
VNRRREEDDVTEQYPPIRRFVTGHDADHVAKVLMQGPAANAKYPSPGTVSTLIWSTDRTPADIAVGEEIEDLGARIVGTAPPANGTRFAVIDFPPGNQPRMHRTETIDYVIVLGKSQQPARPRRLRADRRRAVGDRSPHHRRHHGAMSAQRRRTGGMLA